MIDFTPCEVNKFKAYGGANGNKIHIRYQGKGYMLKFPPVSGRNKTMSYTNSCISEYLACHIYGSLGIKVQETLLGVYTDKRGKKISYFDFISSLENQDCNAALKRISARIDMGRIDGLVEETPFLEPVQREFYRIMIRERKEKILDYGMERLLGQERRL